MIACTKTKLRVYNNHLFSSLLCIRNQIQNVIIHSTLYFKDLFFYYFVEIFPIQDVHFCALNEILNDECKCASFLFPGLEMVIEKGYKWVGYMQFVSTAIGSHLLLNINQLNFDHMKWNANKESFSIIWNLLCILMNLTISGRVLQLFGLNFHIFFPQNAIIVPLKMSSI